MDPREVQHIQEAVATQPRNLNLSIVIGSEREAEMFQTTITLFREDEYGRVGEAGYTAQRSYTGQV